MKFTGANEFSYRSENFPEISSSDENDSVAFRVTIRPDENPSVRTSRSLSVVEISGARARALMKIRVICGVGESWTICHRLA